jgi:CO/xanthine dehydrogenase FAD-binding subunit
VLLVLQAKAKIVDSGGKKVIDLKKFYSGDGKKPNILKPGEIITEIQVPVPSPHSGGVYLKLRLRKAIDYPLLGVAVNLKDAALALTAVERAPLLIKERERLKGKNLINEVIEGLAEAAYKQAHPLNNICELTPTYRKDMVKVYVKSAVQQALENVATGGGTA